MKYEIKKVEGDLIRITFPDERWYFYEKTESHLPSVTWIANYWHKDDYLIKWIAKHGWDDAEMIKKEKGNRGTRVHNAIEYLIEHKEIGIDQKFYSEATDREEDLTADEWECVMSFQAWFEKVNPEILEVEIPVFQLPNETFSHGYAGTIDLVCKIDGEHWIVDLKTSADIHKPHILQQSAYKAVIEKKYKGIKLGILQVGYARNKNKYKFTEIQDRLDLFKLAYKTWDEEVHSKLPLQRSYPIKIKLNGRHTKIKLPQRRKRVSVRGNRRNNS